MISNANIIQNDSHCNLLIQSNMHDGPELITNGSFDTDSDWTKGVGWSISGGAAVCDGTQTAASYLQQDTNPPGPGTKLNKNYKVTYTITRSAGTFKVYIGNQGGADRTSAGTYEDFITPINGVYDTIYIGASSDFVGTVTIISVVEIYNYIVDSSRGGTTHTITNNGGVVHSTTQKKNSFSSLYFDGSDDYLSIPDADDFNFGSGNFSIGFWIYITDKTIYRDIITKQDGSIHSWWFYSDDSGKIHAAISPDGTSGNAFTLTGVTDVTNSWKYLLLVRSNNNFYLFVDGISEDSDIQSVTVYNSNLDVRIGGKSGGSPTSNPLKGYISDISIHDVALHTRNFTPPNRMI